MPNKLNELVVYHIFIDRFAGFASVKNWQSGEYLGGNLKGITQKLPYLKDLGINTLWISPFCKSGVYHGYSVTDFYDVDPHFGTIEDLKKLIDAAHAMSMKIIGDFVPNHCSSKHPYFIDAISKPDSPYRNWFIFEHWPDTYLSFLSFTSLPKLNLNNQATMEHIRGAAKKWLELGLDGYRLDHIVGLSNKNIHTLFDPLKQEFPEAFYVGEAWDLAIRFKELKTIGLPNKYVLWTLRKFGHSIHRRIFKKYIGLIDGVLDFEAAELFDHYGHTDSESEQSMLQNQVESEIGRFDEKLTRFTFLDNHDMDRFLFRMGNDVERLKRAVKLQFSLQAPTIIYYGTEVGMTQTESHLMETYKSDTLAIVRQPMIWDADKQNKELHDFYKQLIRERTK